MYNTNLCSYLRFGTRSNVFTKSNSIFLCFFLSNEIVHFLQKEIQKQDIIDSIKLPMIGVMADWASVIRVHFSYQAFPIEGYFIIWLPLPFYTYFQSIAVLSSQRLFLFYSF